MTLDEFEEADCIGPIDAADNIAVAQHVIIIFVPLAPDRLVAARLSSKSVNGPSPLRLLVAIVTSNSLHEHHDLAPQIGIVNSHERSDQA
jgi:hypothetical protein